MLFSLLKSLIFPQIDMKMTYLSESQLLNLRAHKYSCINKGLLAHYLLSHYWNFFLNYFIPSWMA